MCPKCGEELGGIPLPEKDERGYDEYCWDAYVCYACKTCVCYPWRSIPYERIVKLLQAVAWCGAHDIHDLYVKES